MDAAGVGGLGEARFGIMRRPDVRRSFDLGFAAAARAIDRTWRDRRHEAYNRPP